MEYQEYNEKQFAAKANKSAMVMWLALSLILSLAYVVEVVKGLQSIEYFVIMYKATIMTDLYRLLILKANI